MFVVCAPGLEPMLGEELSALGIRGERQRATVGGIEVDGDLETLYRLHLELGLALKVLLRLGRFPARHFEVLVKRVAELPWELWCAEGVAISARASCKASKLYHSGAVCERVLQGIETRLDRAVLAPREEQDADSMVEVQARLERDTCTLSIDVSGQLLHRRGYRLATAKAPLREDLARALILASGWDRKSPLVDPFCGSGTILIEADWLARGVAPGHARRFAFMHAPCFDAPLFERLRREVMARHASRDFALSGSDRDIGAIRAARSNAERAGSELEWVAAPLSSSPVFDRLEGRGALVTNPPYGLRIGHDRSLDALYRALGERVQQCAAALQLGIAVATKQHALATGLALRSALMTDHGGSKIYFAVGEHQG